MKVALVTNYGDHCSIAEYAKNLVEHMPTDEVEMEIVSHPLTFEHVYEKTRDADIIHLNYIGYWMEHKLLPLLAKAKEPRQKIVITYQETPTKFEDDYDGADAVVLHEPFGDYGNKVHLIPNGIKLVPYNKDVQSTLRLGSAGFWAPHKGFRLVAEAGEVLELGSLLLMSQSPCYDSAETQADRLRMTYPSARIDTSWLPYDAVVNELAFCSMSIFPYDIRTYSIGIGNAVRFGLAAGRPVLVTRGHSHFRDLVDYEDEVYFIDNNDVIGTVKLVHRDLENGCERLPKRLLAAMNWWEVAQQYADLYTDLGA